MSIDKNKIKTELQKRLNRLSDIGLQIVSDNQILVEMYNEGEIDIFDILFQAEIKANDILTEMSMMKELSDVFPMGINKIADITNESKNDINDMWHQELSEAVSIAASCFKIKDPIIHEWAKKNITDVQLISEALEKLS